MDDSLISFESFWRSVRAYPWWQVAIELLLIGAVVYWVIRFLRGTRGSAQVPAYHAEWTVSGAPGAAVTITIASEKGGTIRRDAVLR